MTDAPAAIAGTFTTYKHVPSRGVVQLVIEIPVEAQAAAFAALGYPEPGKSLHVAVARLDIQNSRGQGLAPHTDGAADITTLALGNGSEHPARDTPIQSSDTAHSAGNVSAEGVSPSHGVSEAKARYDAKTDMEKAVVRAVLLCRDEGFQDWLYAQAKWRRGEDWTGERGESHAADWMRHEVGVASRRFIATDLDAYLRFIALENRYRMAVGMLAEERG